MAKTSEVYMNELTQILQQLHIGITLRAILLIVLGFFIARIISTSLSRALRRRLTRQQAMLLRRFAFYFVFVLFIVSAIQQLGFRITALLGATGILTIAVGIASQTSFANIISGIFIIGEKPFELGDIIRVNDLEGEVMSIDLLSVKVRTHDNMMVRLPNETLVKSAIINVSYFPKRRIDILLSIAYKENLERVKDILLTTAEKNKLALNDPEPSILIMQFGDAINMRFSVWAPREDVNAVKNSLFIDIKNAFDAANIEMPSSSTRTLYLGENKESLSVKIVQ
jgi:small-conductance mechanosensitive channel